MRRHGYYFARNNRFLLSYILTNVEIYGFHFRDYKLQFNVLVEGFFWGIHTYCYELNYVPPKFFSRSPIPQYLKM